MAANNYYITGNGNVDSLGRPIFQVTESVGDSVFFENMVSSGSLTIVSNPGYTVAASNFSITNLTALTTPFSDDGTENPDYKWVETITLTDTGTAGTTSNTILVTVNLISSGPRGSLTLDGDFLIKLDIDGTAIEDNVAPDVDFNNEIIIENNSDEPTPGVETFTNANANITLAPETGVTMDTIVNGDFSEITLVGQVSPNVLTDIGNANVVADTGYYLQEQPYFVYMNMPNNSPSALTLSSPTITRNSDNRITAYNFNIMYKNNVNMHANSGAKAFLRYKTVKIPTATTEIKNVTYGSTQLSSVSEIRPITVYGDVNAEFDLTITKDSDGSSILNSNVANTTILSPEYGTITAINKKLISRGRKAGRASFQFNQEFPSGTDKYYINIYPKGSTTLKSSIPIIKPHYTIEQYANPVLTLTASAGTNYTLTTYAAITYTGKPNTHPGQLKHISTTPKIFSFSYVASRASSYTFTTANNPTWSSTVQTSSNWTNSVYADNNGTHLEIFNLKTTTNHGATTATITGDVLIKKWGTANVTMDLTTSAFLTSG